jgi:ParB-like chromosome segregation protein Spo0J
MTYATSDTRRGLWREILAVHPAADAFPMMTDTELLELGEDITTNGLKVPIVLWAPDCNSTPVLLDGRNRLAACELVGLRVFDGADIRLPVNIANDTDPFEFVLSANLHRRHLNASQRAMIATRLATLGRGGDVNASNDALTQDDAADRLNVSRASVQRARKVLETADDELIGLVDAGKVSVALAADVAACTDRTDLVQRLAIVAIDDEDDRLQVVKVRNEALRRRHPQKKSTTNKQSKRLLGKPDVDGDAVDSGETINGMPLKRVVVTDETLRATVIWLGRLFAAAERSTSDERLTVDGIREFARQLHLHAASFENLATLVQERRYAE